MKGMTISMLLSLSTRGLFVISVLFSLVLFAAPPVQTQATSVSQQMAATAMTRWKDSWETQSGRTEKWSYDQGVVLKGIESLWLGTADGKYFKFIQESIDRLSDLERKLQPENKAEDLIGGEGMQLRVAIQHDKSRPTAAAELHDASDDVYYVLEGTATLVLGGKLDAPHEIEPGEWRSPKINGGQTFQITKGDLIVVPRGMPHQRTGKDFSMILIKVFAAPQPAPKPAASPPAVKP